MKGTLKRLGEVRFPSPSGIMVNMMPFIFGDSWTIPGNMKQYIPLIDACEVPDVELGRVCYLTVREGMVEAEQVQSRGGIHIEAPVEHSWGGGGGTTWGGGHRSGSGLYMASNLSNTCRAWDGLVYDHTEGKASVLNERLMKHAFGDPVYMKAGELWWLTDHTPHEALPQEHTGYRQFFRLVTSEVSLWYSQHNTANPLGIEPGCTIVHHNKFEESN